MSYYGHICRHKTMAKTIIQDKVEGTRARGRTKKEYFGCQRYQNEDERGCRIIAKQAN